MLIKALVDNELYGIWDTEKANELDCRIIRKIRDRAKIDKKYKLVKATEEELQEWNEMWESLISKFEE